MDLGCSCNLACKHISPNDTTYETAAMGGEHFSSDDMSKYAEIHQGNAAIDKDKKWSYCVMKILNLCQPTFATSNHSLCFDF